MEPKKIDNISLATNQEVVSNEVQSEQQGYISSFAQNVLWGASSIWDGVSYSGAYVGKIVNSTLYGTSERATLLKKTELSVREILGDCDLDPQEVELLVDEIIRAYSITYNESEEKAFSIFWDFLEEVKKEREIHLSTLRENKRVDLDKRDSPYQKAVEKWGLYIPIVQFVKEKDKIRDFFLSILERGLAINSQEYQEQFAKPLFSETKTYHSFISDILSNNHSQIKLNFMPGVNRHTYIFACSYNESTKDNWLKMALFTNEYTKRDDLIVWQKYDWVVEQFEQASDDGLRSITKGKFRMTYIFPGCDARRCSLDIDLTPFGINFENSKEPNFERCCAVFEVLSLALSGRSNERRLEILNENQVGKLNFMTDEQFRLFTIFAMNLEESIFIRTQSAFLSLGDHKQILPEIEKCTHELQKQAISYGINEIESHLKQKLPQEYREFLQLALSSREIFKGMNELVVSAKKLLQSRKNKREGDFKELEKNLSNAFGKLKKESEQLGNDVWDALKQLANAIASVTSFQNDEVPIVSLTLKKFPIDNRLIMDLYDQPLQKDPSTDVQREILIIEVEKLIKFSAEEQKESLREYLKQPENFYLFKQYLWSIQHQCEAVASEQKQEMNFYEGHMVEAHRRLIESIQENQNEELLINLFETLKIRPYTSLYTF